MQQKHTFDDEYDGVGGSYIVNPKTGKREPAKANEPVAEPKINETEEVKDGLKK
jgi:hypothetical protein